MTADVRDRQTRKRQTGRQTGQVHGQHSVVWHQESEGSDSSTPPPPWKVQWILADRGEEDTRCLEAAADTQPSTFSPACDLEAVQGGARRSLFPVVSSLHQSVKKEEQQVTKRSRMIMAVMTVGGGRGQERGFKEAALAF